MFLVSRPFSSHRFHRLLTETSKDRSAFLLQLAPFAMDAFSTGTTAGLHINWESRSTGNEVTIFKISPLSGLASSPSSPSKYCRWRFCCLMAGPSISMLPSRPRSSCNSFWVSVWWLHRIRLAPYFPISTPAGFRRRKQHRTSFAAFWVPLVRRSLMTC